MMLQAHDCKQCGRLRGIDQQIEVTFVRVLAGKRGTINSRMGDVVSTSKLAQCFAMGCESSDGLMAPPAASL